MHLENITIPLFLGRFHVNEKYNNDFFHQRLLFAKHTTNIIILLLLRSCQSIEADECNIIHQRGIWWYVSSRYSNGTVGQHGWDNESSSFSYADPSLDMLDANNGKQHDMVVVSIEIIINVCFRPIVALTGDRHPIPVEIVQKVVCPIRRKSKHHFLFLVCPYHQS